MMDITRRKLLLLILAAAGAPRKSEAGPITGPLKPELYWKYAHFTGFKTSPGSLGVSGLWLALRSDGICFYTTVATAKPDKEYLEAKKRRARCKLNIFLDPKFPVEKVSRHTDIQFWRLVDYNR